MSASEIVSICIPALVALVSIIFNIITLSKKGKKATALSILSAIPDYVTQAESIFGAGNGQAKLQWVLTKVQIDAVKANINIEDSEIKARVESVMEAPQKKVTQETEKTEGE